MSNAAPLCAAVDSTRRGFSARDQQGCRIIRRRQPTRSFQKPLQKPVPRSAFRPLIYSHFATPGRSLFCVAGSRCVVLDI
jgi:hypothetical protein